MADASPAGTSRVGPSGAERTRAADEVAITGIEAASAFGRGLRPLAEAVFSGASCFSRVTRFDTALRKVDVAATAPGDPDLFQELVRAVAQACDAAGLAARERAETQLLLAAAAEPSTARLPPGRRIGRGAGGMAAALARRCGLSPAARAYTTACVAGSSAVADAGAMIRAGRAERVLVAAGYLVEADRFAIFDAGRALATDGRMRPFSVGRSGVLLGDAVVAVVLEAAGAARRRGVEPLARVTGWGRAGDAHHVTNPDPGGLGLARAIAAALRRAGSRAEDLDYINAHGAGSLASDRSESAALRVALGEAAGEIPLSSSKGSHGYVLEATALLDLAVTVAALCEQRLPVNAGTLAPDADCGLALVGAPRAARLGRALSTNSAFGGANTALVIDSA